MQTGALGRLFGQILKDQHDTSWFVLVWTIAQAQELGLALKVLDIPSYFARSSECPKVVLSNIQAFSRGDTLVLFTLPVSISEWRAEWRANRHLSIGYIKPMRSSSLLQAESRFVRVGAMRSVVSTVEGF